MRTFQSLFIPVLLLAFVSCSEIDDGGMESGEYAKLDSYGLSGGGDGSGAEDPSGNGNEDMAGLVTAGEWNDLDNWDFWEALLNGQEFSEMPAYWDIFTRDRISLDLSKGGSPVCDAEVSLARLGTVLWSARTDNQGRAEFWISPFQEASAPDLLDFQILVEGEVVKQSPTLYSEGINVISLPGAADRSSRVEISFIVDATGSMSDELEFLKADLQHVIDSVSGDITDIDIFTSTVFYRDEGDEYVVRKSEFTSDLGSTIDFIEAQRANGGGDYPEAVHTAMHAGISELQWSDQARTRIAFVLLDAPPHYQGDVVRSLHASIEEAAEKGIRIIPIAASGVNKETEFLLRFMAILSNGTYAFITDDSGIGNEHLVASVGEYEVELLKGLMVRLIKEYSE